MEIEVRLGWYAIFSSVHNTPSSVVGLTFSKYRARNLWRFAPHLAQWVGGVAVEMAGGPAAPLLPGRQDCNCFDNSSVIADECSSLDQLADYWRAPLIHHNKECHPTYVLYDHMYGDTGRRYGER